MRRVVNRRALLGMAGACAMSSAARGEPWLRRYVVIYCDPTLKPVLRRVADGFTARTGAPVTIFAAPPAVSLGLLAHDTQNDLLVTTAQSAQSAADAGLLAKQPVPAPLWRNRLVIAASATDAAPLSALDPAPIMARLGDGFFALTDATQAATIDAPLIIQKLGLADALAHRTVPAASTDEIGFLIRTGAARLGLCHRTDVRSDPALAEVARLPDNLYPPIGYCIARTRKAWSANMDAFETYLTEPNTVAMLNALGLDRA